MCGEAVYCYMIGSQSFSEPMLLDSKLYKSFLVFLSPPLGGTRWLEWAGVAYFPSPTWKGQVLTGLGISLPKVCWALIILHSAG